MESAPAGPRGARPANLRDAPCQAARSAGVKLQQVDSSVVGLALARVDGSIVHANDEYLRIVGYSREELDRGQLRWTDMTPPEWLEVSRQAIDHLMANGASPLYEKEYLRKDGSRVPVLIALAKLPTPDPFVDFAGFVVDPSAAAEEPPLKERFLVERLAVLESSLDGVYCVDLEGCCTYINTAAARILGFEPEECTGKKMHDLVHCACPDGEASPADGCPACVLQQGGAERVDHLVFRKRDGAAIETECSSHPILAHGKIEGSVVSMKDIGERKRAEEELRASEERYRRIVENTQEGICMCDANRCVTYCNHRLSAMLGYEAGTQLPCSAMHYDEDEEDILHRFERRRTGLSETYEKRLKRKDGSTLWVNTSASPILDDQGEFAGSLCMFTDVSERRRLEEQLRHAQKMEAVGRLAGGIAHDFNNLLTVILGYIGVLERKLAGDSSLLRNIVEIRKAGDRAAGLTQKLLAFSRKQVLRPRAMSLNALIRDVEAMLRRLVGEDVELVIALDPAVGNIQADPGQIEQVLLNLAINARDAMHQRGRLLIETKRQERDADRMPSLAPGPYAVLSVTDNGCGMDESTRTRIFEPFFTTKEPGLGTGLGLSSVLGIVNQSGGAISVVSEPGAGAAFHVYLPMLASGTCQSSTNDQRGGTRPVRILVVDDEPQVRTFLATSLEAEGYRVLQAANGKEAEAMCQTKSADLVITDLVMPEQEGLETIKALRRTEPEIPVIAISGAFAGAYLEVAKKLGADAVFQKPFEAQSILDEVRRLTSR